MDNKNYRFGIIVSRYLMTAGYRSLRSIGVCNCGQHEIREYAVSKIQCQNCGNEFFVDAKGQNRPRFVIPYLEAERKNNRGFKVKRVNLSVIYDGESVKPVKENLRRTIDYDIVDKTLKVWRDEELEYDSNLDNKVVREDVNRRFFTQLDHDLFLDFISSDVTREMYGIVKSLSNIGWNRKKSIIKGLHGLMDQQWLQILSNAGIPRVDRFYNSSKYYGSDVIDYEKTKPHEILKVPKFMMTYIREDVSIDTRVLRSIQGNFKNIDNNKFREIMSVVKDESNMRELSNSLDNLMSIHVDYDYSNIKKLVLYLFRECRLMQGIQSPNTASTLLRDYIRMSRTMGLEYEKYPKSLKKEHDVVQMNYKLITNGKEEQELFKMSVDKKSYRNLAFKSKKHDYIVTIPKEPDELVKEGNQLSHCLASYIKDVTSDRCKILFLRDKNEEDKPLVSIEVRGMNVRQARGFANRQVKDEEKEFIKLWAEEKGLVEAYY